MSVCHHWCRLRSLQHVFVAYDQHLIYTYVYSCDTVEGASCSLIGTTKLPFGQHPLMLYAGEVSCQTLTGKVRCSWVYMVSVCRVRCSWVYMVRCCAVVVLLLSCCCCPVVVSLNVAVVVRMWHAWAGQCVRSATAHLAGG